MSDYDNASVRAQGKAASARNPYLGNAVASAVGLAQSNAAQSVANAATGPAEPTIVSGIQRLKDLVRQGETMLAASRGFVEAMEGQSSPKPSDSPDEGNDSSQSTAAALHTVAKDLGNVMWAMHALFARAKAVHG